MLEKQSLESFGKMIEKLKEDGIEFDSQILKRKEEIQVRKVANEKVVEERKSLSEDIK